MSAYFEGTPDEFYKFLGARTSNIVTEISKPFRKIQRSCRDEDIDENANKKVCGKRKSLDAAHLKDRTRKILIQEILEEYGIENEKGIYKISIYEFEEEFRNKHKDFFKVIQFRCRKHHRAYDIKNKIENNEDEYVEIEASESIICNTDINFETTTKEVKAVLIQNMDYLNKDNCSVARISHDNWNFNINVEKVKSDFYLICFNQFDFYVTILKITAKTLKSEMLIKKSNPKKMSLNVPFSEIGFVEKTSGYILEYIDSVQL